MDLKKSSSDGLLFEMSEDDDVVNSEAVNVHQDKRMSNKQGVCTVHDEFSKQHDHMHRLPSLSSH